MVEYSNVNILKEYYANKEVKGRFYKVSEHFFIIIERTCEERKKRMNKMKRKCDESEKRLKITKLRANTNF